MNRLSKLRTVFVIVFLCIGFLLPSVLMMTGCEGEKPGQDVQLDPEREEISPEDYSEIQDYFSDFEETPDESEEDSSDKPSENNSASSEKTDTSEKNETSDNPVSTDSDQEVSGTTTQNPPENSDSQTPPPVTPPAGGSGTTTVVPVTTNIADSLLYNSIAKSRKAFPAVPKNLSINNVPLAFDEASSTFCYSISENSVGKSVRYSFGGVYDGEALSVVFQNNLIKPDGMFKASANQTIKVRVFTSKYYADYSLRISIVPVMTIEIKNRQTLPNNDTSTLDCTVTVQNPDYETHGGAPYLASYATVHNRGASSIRYPKKSMKIELQKFVEEGGKTIMEERKKPLLGMRDDDDWILDACYADPTMMHNKMAYNLWEEIGGDTNPDAILAGPHCEYVEVILNGTYHGLFLLVEPVDEKQMGVDKTENTTNGTHGVFIKTTSWTDTKFDTITGSPKNPNGTYKAIWNGFEMKYPETGIKASDWDPLYKLLDATVNGSDAEFVKVASKYLDKENIVNYWILISVTLARDNAGKNICWSIHNLSDANPKMYINVWDMDNTFGYRYGVPPKKDPVTTENYADKWFKLLQRYLSCNVDGSADYLKARWAELTKSGAPCSVEALHARIETEAAFLNSSGAFLREQARWPAGSSHASLPNPLATEVTYAKTWVKDRIPVVEKIVEKY